MTPEEQLDHLIERWEHSALPEPGDGDELAARLAAAEALKHLQGVAEPPGFAARLEARVRARARSLTAQQGRRDCTSTHPGTARATSANGKPASTRRQRLTPRIGEAPRLETT